MDAVAPGEAIIRAQDPVHLGVYLVERLYPHAVLLVVHLAFHRVQVRQRRKAQDALRDRADPARRNEVPGERGTPTSVGRAGERVVDGRVAGRQIAAAEGRARQAAAVHLAQMIPAALIVSEKEELVANNASADRPAELVVHRGCLRHRKRVARLDILIAVKLEQAAVIVVRAALKGNVGHRAAGIAELGVEVRGGHIDGLDSLGRRNQRGQVAIVDLVLNAFNLEVVKLPALPVDAHAERILGVVELRVRAEGTAHAGHQHQEALVVAVIEHGHFGQLLGVDLAASVGAIGLQQRRGRAADVDGLRDGARGEFKIHAGRGVGWQLDAGTHGLAKALLFGLHAVVAGIQVDEEEVSRLIGLGGALEVRPGLDQSDLYPGHGSAGLIRDRPQNLALQDLRG